MLKDLNKIPRAKWKKIIKKNKEAPLAWNHRKNKIKLASSVILIKNQKELTVGVKRRLKINPETIWIIKIIPKKDPPFQK